METTDSLIPVILGVGAGTYLVRALPFLLGRGMTFSPYLLDWLIFVSLGIMAGLVSKALFVIDGRPDMVHSLPGAAGTLLAVVLHRMTGNTLLSLGAGLVATALLGLF